MPTRRLRFQHHRIIAAIAVSVVIATSVVFVVVFFGGVQIQRRSAALLTPTIEWNWNSGGGSARGARSPLQQQQHHREGISDDGANKTADLAASPQQIKHLDNDSVVHGAHVHHPGHEHQKYTHRQFVDAYDRPANEPEAAVTKAQEPQPPQRDEDEEPVCDWDWYNCWFDHFYEKKEEEGGDNIVDVAAEAGPGILLLFLKCSVPKSQISRSKM